MTDLRLAVRHLLNHRGFSALAIFTLALGIGACVTMFSIVQAVLLKSLPFRDPERLVWIENSGHGGMSAITTRVDNFLDWREQSKSFETLGAYFAFFDYSRYTLTGAGDPQRLRGVGISQNLLEVLGVQPLLGRSFVEEECLWNGRKAALLSHAFWQQRFGGDRSIVGRTLTLNGEPTEVVGIMPESFDFDAIFSPGMRVELLVPFPLVEQTARWGNTLFAIGRLKPGATRSQAQSELDLICARLHETHPERGRDHGARVSGLETSIRGQFRGAFLILLGAVGCVLLIACVNLSNLLLARAIARRREFAIRMAMGAHPWRLIRLPLVESFLLAVCACALGTSVALVATPHLAGLQTFSIPLLGTAAVDGTVLAASVAISVLAGLFCGALPAIQLLSRDLRDSLNESGHRGSPGQRSASIRRALVVTQVAAACLLLIGAGLLIRSFVGIMEVNPGFQPARTVAWRADSTRSFSSPAEANLYYDELAQRVEAVSGVESVGITDTLPLGRNRSWGAGAKGESYRQGEYPDAFPRIVDYRYLQTMRIPLREGRYFDSHDTAETEHVIIINETMARNLWHGRTAVGQIVDLGRADWRVIGVVGDVRHGALDKAPQAEMYLNFRQTTDWSAMELVVRSSRSPESFVPDVRAAIKTFDPNLPTAEFTTLEQVVDRAVAPRRLITELLGVFSSLGLVLALIGLYGVIAYSVSQRVREMGIRMTLGAHRHDIFVLVVYQGLKLTGVGLGIGLVCSLALSRIMGGLLFGVRPIDPMTFVAIPALFIGIAVLACWFPARHAAKTDPMEALRGEG